MLHSHTPPRAEQHMHLCSTGKVASIGCSRAVVVKRHQGTQVLKPLTACSNLSTCCCPHTRTHRHTAAVQLCSRAPDGLPLSTALSLHASSPPICQHVLSTFTRAVHAMHATRSPHVNPALDAAVPAPYYTCAAAGAAAAAGRGTASCCCVPAAAWSATVCAAASSQPSCSLTHIPVLCVSPPITLGSARGSW